MGRTLSLSDLAALVPALAVLALSLSGCNLPRDPEGTTGRVRSNELVVGLLEGAGGTCGESLAPRARLILDSVARDLDARLACATGSPDDLIEAVDAGRVHVLAGRLPASSPLADELGISTPVGRMNVGSAEEDEVFGVRRGENGFLMRLDRAILRHGSGT